MVTSRPRDLSFDSPHCDRPSRRLLGAGAPRLRVRLRRDLGAAQIRCQPADVREFRGRLSHDSRGELMSELTGPKSRYPPAPPVDRISTGPPSGRPSLPPGVPVPPPEPTLVE